MLLLIAPLVAASFAAPSAPDPQLEAELLSLDAHGYGFGGRTAVGDWNGDGRPDAAHAAGDATLVAWGPSLFDSSLLIGTSPGAVDAANLASDEGLDRLLLAGPEGLTVHAYVGVGLPLSRTTLTTAPCTRVVVLADGNTGERLVVALGAEGTALQAFEAHPNGTFTALPAHSIGSATPVNALAVIDWDGDGADDLVLTHAVNVELWDARFDRIDQFTLLAPPRDLVTSDNRGVPAILALFEFPLGGYPDWQWLAEVTPAGAGAFVSLGAAGYDLVRAGDLNVDGVPDVALADADAPVLDVLWGKATGPTYSGAAEPIPLPGNVPAAAGHAIADFDNDGDQDVLAFPDAGLGILFASGTSDPRPRLELLPCSAVAVEGTTVIALLYFSAGHVGVAPVEIEMYRATSSGGVSIEPTPTVIGPAPVPTGYMTFGPPLDALDEDVWYVLVLRAYFGGEPGPDTAVDFSAGAPCPADDAAQRGGWFRGGGGGAGEAHSTTEGVDPRPRVDLD